MQYSAPFYSAVEEDEQVTLSLLLLGETAIPVTVMVSSILLDTNSNRTAATCEDMHLCVCTDVSTLSRYEVFSLEQILDSVCVCVCVHY